MHSLRVAYWYFETYVLLPIVGSRAMRLVDKMIGSECKYCMTLRGAFMGAAGVHAVQWSWMAVPLLAVPLLLTWAERTLGDQHEQE